MECAYKIKFRDIFSKKLHRKYDADKMKTQLKAICRLIKPLGLVSEAETNKALDIIDLYDADKINEQKLEEYLFNFNGFRNIVHNRIREKIDDKEFIEKVGNPTLLSNLLSAM